MCKLLSTFRPSKFVGQEAHLAFQRMTKDMWSSADDEAPLKILSFLFSPNRSKHNKGNKPLNNITATKKKERIPKPQTKLTKSSENTTAVFCFLLLVCYCFVIFSFVIHNLPVLPALEPSNLSQGGPTVPNQLHYAAGLCEFIEIGTRHGLFI